MASGTNQIQLQKTVRNQLNQSEPLNNTPSWFLDQLTAEISSRLKHLHDSISSSGQKANELPSNELEEKVQKFQYFTPSVVSVVYSIEKAKELERFVQQATQEHFRFMQRAVSNVVRRFTGFVRQYGEASDLEDELWGQTMEDFMRQLTDRSARLWDTRTGEALIFPPETQRRGAQSPVVRLALNEEITKLALYHADHTVSVWDAKSQVEMKTFDLSLWMEENVIPVAMHFSQSQKKLGIEFSDKIVMLDIDNQHESDQNEIKSFSLDDLDTLFNEFGSITPAYRDRIEKNKWNCTNYSGQQVSADHYKDLVFDWVCDSSGRYLATASERKRRMPPWMMDIGFESAVYVIVKRRLIDWIRKNNHDSYVCWYCGSASSSINDTHCRQCGADFSACLLGLPSPPCDPPRRESQWTCSHCGMSSRMREPMGEPKADDLYGERDFSNYNWQNEHDLYRIQEKLKDVTVTYRKRAISCNRFLELKAQGLTNEEIGNELDIPRGSVDYIWNQCRSHILEHFDEQYHG